MTAEAPERRGGDGFEYLAGAREGWTRVPGFGHAHWIRCTGWALCGGIVVAAGTPLAADDGRRLFGDCPLCRELLDRRAARAGARRVAS